MVGGFICVLAGSCLPPRGQQGRPNESLAFRQRVCLWLPGPSGARVGGKIIIHHRFVNVKSWEIIAEKIYHFYDKKLKDSKGCAHNAE